jgi:conjugative relaxase-like TrwC/TraI family protein
VLNIAVIRSVRYYLDQVARTRADYYQGRGESPGRWQGTLAARLGFSGTVEGDALRALLEGRHPGDGLPILPGRPHATEAKPARRDPGAVALGINAAADVLGVSTRTVRRWVAAGDRVWSDVQAATPDRKLSAPAEVRARLGDMAGSADASAGGKKPSGCLLVPPAEGRRRRLEISRDEVERLRDTHRAPAARQGYDIVFRPAKGWSVLWAVGPPRLRRELRRIHHRAVADALAYLEDTAARGRTTVRWLGRRVRVRARGEGFVVACFDHRESRAGDPLLHTHCLVANFTRLPDGRLVALESSGLFRQQRAADAVYRATFLNLAAERLGIGITKTESVFPEPDGVAPVVIAEFSKRSDEIADEVARHGSASAAARQLAALATRRAKEIAGRAEDLHARWRAEATRLGFGESDVATCLGRTTPYALGDHELAVLFEDLVAPGGLTAEAATFTRANLVRALGDRLGGAVAGPRLGELAEEFVTSGSVVPVREHRPGQPRGRMLDGADVVDDPAAARFSVPELAACEARLLAAIPAAGGPTVDAATLESVLGRHPHLSGEQAAMVRSVCTTPSLLRPVVGLPGAGKTTAAGALVEALREAGVPLVGCAVTATAADELARRAGLDSCDTLARVLLDLDTVDAGGLRHGTVVIADEASMLPSRGLDRLVAHVRAAGGALVLIGDPHQHPAVGPGSFFARVVAERPDTPALTGNLRRAGPLASSEANADRAMRDGLIAEALRLRDEAGLLTRGASPAELHTRLVDDWWADWPATRDPMIAPSNDTRERLNAAARKALDCSGALHGPVLVAGTKEFRAGDRVVARRNDRRLRSPADPRWWVRNGACGDIVEVHPDSGEAVVAFDASGDARPHRLRLPSEYVAAHLEHAYALTDYGVQGRTLHRARAVLDETSTTPGAYVASTRGRHENRLYVADGDSVDTDGLDCSHGIPRVRAPGLDALGARVATRRPEGMLHDRDPYLAEAVALAATTSLDDLHGEAEVLARRLASIPADPSRSLGNAEVALERLLRAADSNGRTAGSVRGDDSNVERLRCTVTRLRRDAEQHRIRRAAVPEWQRRRAVLAEAIAMTEARRRRGRPRDMEATP